MNIVRGNIIRFTIDRQTYHLANNTSHYASTLCGTVTHLHKHKVSVKAMDLWDTAKPIKYFTIDKNDILAVL